MPSKIFNSSRKRISNTSRLFVRNSFEVINRIQEISKRQGYLTQKELAKKLGKTESEISKLLSPGHNLTLKTISKIEDVLGEKILFPEKEKNISITVVYAKTKAVTKASRINHMLEKKRKRISSTTYAEC